MTLVINRYNQVTPTVVTDEGTSISTPFYINPTTDKKKEVLNAFRKIKAKQLIEMGHDTSPVQQGSLSVINNLAAPQSPIEQELGVTEENLRMMIFGRNGINEKLIIQLQNLTGVQLVTRQDAENCFQLWCDHLFPDENNGLTTATKKTTKRTAKRSSAST